MKMEKISVTYADSLSRAEQYARTQRLGTGGRDKVSDRTTMHSNPEHSS